MNRPAVQMARHVALICANNSIRLETYKGNGRAWKRDRMIKFKAIRGPVSYFVALHEIGHIVGKGRSAPKLEEEANAWLYALETAMCPPPLSVRKHIMKALDSYFQSHLHRRGLRHNMKAPPGDHPFWQLLNYGELR